MSIFSVIGLGAHQMLKTVIDSHDRIKTQATVHAQLNLAMAAIQRDFNQFVPRPIRDAYGDAVDPLVMGGELYDVEFTRTGWSNPAGMPRSQLQRVAYKLDYDTHELSRYFWKVLDRVEDSEPLSRVILTGVEGFQIAGMFPGQDDPADAERLNEELLEGTPSQIPIAVEVTISTTALGDVVRMFELVEPYAPAFVARDEQPDRVDDTQTDDLTPDDQPDQPLLPAPDVDGDNNADNNSDNSGDTSNDQNDSSNPND